MGIVGDNIRHIRMARNITQSDLGERIGKNQRTISNWERGFRHPSNDDVRKLAEILSVAPAEIIGHTEQNDDEYEYIVTTDDMYPDIKRGDTLKVHRSIQPDDGDLVVIEMTDKKTQLVRRLYRLGRMLSLLAVNPSIKPINTDQDSVQIKGKVTELRRRV